MSIGERELRSASPGLTARSLLALALAVSAMVLVGCRQDMHDQPYYEPYEASEFFPDGSTNQPIPAGTVARGLLKDDTHFWFGRDESGGLVDTLPAQMQWDRAMLERGRERFDIYCSICHDTSGSGRGMIVQRGFKQPQPLYEDRLRAMPLGYFYDVATNGFGIMPSYSRMVPTEDRWAIAAYIRVLQQSQGMRLEELPPAVQQSFQSALAALDHHDDGHDDGHGEAGHGDQDDSHGGGH